MFVTQSAAGPSKLFAGKPYISGQVPKVVRPTDKYSLKVIVGLRGTSSLRRARFEHFH